MRSKKLEIVSSIDAKLFELTVQEFLDRKEIIFIKYAVGNYEGKTEYVAFITYRI